MLLVIKMTIINKLWSGRNRWQSTQLSSHSSFRTLDYVSIILVPLFLSFYFAAVKNSNSEKVESNGKGNLGNGADTTVKRTMGSLNFLSGSNWLNAPSSWSIFAPHPGAATDPTASSSTKTTFIVSFSALMSGIYTWNEKKKKKDFH